MTRAIQLRFNSDLIPTCYFWFTSLLLTRFISHDRVLVEIAGACDRVLLSKSPTRCLLSSSRTRRQRRPPTPHDPALFEVAGEVVEWNGSQQDGSESETAAGVRSAPGQSHQAHPLYHYIKGTIRATRSRDHTRWSSKIFSSGLLLRVSKAKLKEYSDKIESLAGKLAAPVHDQSEDLRAVDEIKEEKPSSTEHVGSDGNSAGLRRRTTSRTEDRSRQTNETDTSAPVRLDETARTHIEKHRKLQEDLTDEMVVLARQLKESSLLMNQSLHDTEKILDSTEKAVEHSLATTNRANTRATEVYSLSSKTTCFTWLLMFVMTCIFIMVVLLIRVT